MDDKCIKCLHDMSNLITLISGYFEMYLDELNNEKHLKNLKDAIEKLHKLIQDKNKFHKYDI